MVVGSLSNDDGNGRENVTQKVNSRCFKLHCSYPNSFNFSNNGYFFFRSWILKGCMCEFTKGKKNRFLVFTSSIKREIGKVHVVVVQWPQRNVQKRVMNVQSCFFANRNLLLFRRSRWCLRRRCLRSLVTLRVVRNTEALVKGSEESVIACLYCRACVMFCMGKSFLILSSLSVKALKVFWCDFRLPLFCVQWLNCATDTPTLHIKCG